jgi:hypothetical protein
MQYKKQAAAKNECRQCGATLLGKYAAKNHICKRAVKSRAAGLAQQRKFNHG